MLSNLRRAVTNEDESEQSQKIELPAPWDPVDPSKQIGLLSGLYQRLQATPDGLMEVHCRGIFIFSFRMN